MHFTACSSSLTEVKELSGDRNLDTETGAEAMAECCYWLALHASYTIQDNLPTAVGWVLTPTSIINKLPHGLAYKEYFSQL